jgi:1,4-alpha-glucan branching enzyme
MAQQPLDPAAAAALIEGRHGDPFSVLGPHCVNGAWQVLAMVPGADRVWILGRDGATEAQQVAGAPGLFSGALAGNYPYRLRARAGQSEWEWDDAFRFGPVLGALDEHLLAEGRLKRLWQALGAHPIRHEGVAGTHFAVWAPNAARVSVVGPFNLWDGRRHPMRRRGGTGVWETFVPGVGENDAYKYEIRSPEGAVLPLKSDPVGFGSEHPPANASLVRELPARNWADGPWLNRRAAAQAIDAPISIYEVHLGSWRRTAEGRHLSYDELAVALVDYASDMGFTHIELMPISEFPFDGSWGYQPVGLYAPTIRHGTAEEFRAFIEAAHAKGLGVILDWVPGHFPSDAHGLGQFDGTALYEHADPKEGFHRDWNTLIYNYGRTEVANFLVSNALYWLEEYHIDGLRVDAVASMLYRDYSRKAGQWVPNRDGGRENYEAIALLQAMNSTSYGEVPGIVTIAEESTAFPGVTRPVSAGGLGFGYKWNMGWMNDTLAYMQKDPLYRRYHHEQMTFGLHYAWSENFILPLSHDEVVHGKGSLLTKMAGEGAAKFANLRAYLGFMWAHPGKKLLFMGCEFGQIIEWNHDSGLDWSLLDLPRHKGVQTLIRDLNRLYRETPALHLNDCRPEGFQWLDAGDAEGSTFVWARFGGPKDAPLVAVMNFTPVARRVRIGLPKPGKWDEVLNTDSGLYGGENQGNLGGVRCEGKPWHGVAQSALVTLPALSAVFLKWAGEIPETKDKAS